MKKLLFAACAIVSAMNVSAAISAKSYILDGLIGHWDALENAGYGVAHDSASTTWKDLTGSGEDFTIPAAYSWETNGLITVRATAAHTPYGSTAQPFYDAINGCKYSCEIVYNKPNVTPLQTIGYADTKYVVLCGFYFATRTFFGLDGETWVGCNAPGTKGSEKGLSGESAFKVADNKGVHLLSCSQDSTNVVVRFDGTVGNKVVPALADPILTRSTKAVYINRNYGEWDTGLDGTYHTIRFYNRALTEDEAKVNRAVDNLRYFGATMAEANAILPTGWRFKDYSGDIKLEKRNHLLAINAQGGTVEVVGSTEGDKTEFWTEKDVGSTLTIKATPAADYRFAGWIGLGDASKKLNAEVTDVISNDVTAVFIYTGAGANTISAQNYVTNGIVVHYDGINNKSYAAGHDSSATVWKDLRGSGADYTINASVAWTDDNGITVGRDISTMTTKAIPMAWAVFNSGRYTCEMTFNKTQVTAPSTKGYTGKVTGSIFCFYYQTHFWFGLEGETIAGFHPNYAGYGGSPNGIGGYYVKVADNKGKHVLSCSQDGTQTAVRFDQTASFTKTTEAEIVTNKISRKVGEQHLVLNQYYGNYDTGIDGVIYAIRYYDRAISADEYAVNYTLDQVRFFGANPAECELPEGYRFDLTNGICLEKEYAVSADAEKGSVTVGGATDNKVWIEHNGSKSVALTATPQEGYRFRRWTGAITGGNATAATTTLTVNGAVAAEFVELKPMTILFQ